MKRLRSNSNLSRKRYSQDSYVEHSGIGTRRLSEAEIAELQNHVDDVRHSEHQQLKDEHRRYIRTLS